MAKNFGIKPYLFPMPVLMIATYNEDGSVDVMNMAWGGICGDDMVALNIEETRKTAKNIKARGAFTLSIASLPYLKQADYFGIVSGNDTPDKFAKSGLTAVKSTRVDAPVIEEFPITLECKAVEMENKSYGFRILGQIQNVLADESVLTEHGQVDPAKLQAFAFDQFQGGYYALGEKVSQAWQSGRELM